MGAEGCNNSTITLIHQNKDVLDSYISLFLVYIDDCLLIYRFNLKQCEEYTSHISKTGSKTQSSSSWNICIQSFMNYILDVGNMIMEKEEKNTIGTRFFINCIRNWSIETPSG